jgi:hypothetical protein
MVRSTRIRQLNPWAGVTTYELPSFQSLQTFQLFRPPRLSSPATRRRIKERD